MISLPRLLTVLTLFALCMPLKTHAEEAVSPDNLEYRTELAEKLLETRPAKVQVESAINRYVARVPKEKQAELRETLRSALNYKALEKISVDAYVETYTTPELEAMVEYYSKPEARSASRKSGNYAKIVYPEIIRMLDKALMKVRTGEPSP